MNSLPKTCDAKQHRELCKDLDKKVPFKKGFKTSTWSKGANNRIQIEFNKVGEKDAVVGVVQLFR